jgi:hypothetical protein
MSSDEWDRAREPRKAELSTFIFCVIPGARGASYSMLVLHFSKIA